MQPYPQQPYGQPLPPKKSSWPVWLVVIVVLLVAGVFGIGIFAAISIYGVRRYLAAAKTAEAKNTIGAIARGAAASWERETADAGAPHKLCGSAVTVPATVPKATKYNPLSSGGDFDTGDAENGWKCLRFSMVQPIYYQYSYKQGSGYQATSVSPGPTGFEASARGDINGDGTTSLFALTGRPTPTGVDVSRTVYIENEFE
ncbi:MAG: fimbiral protein pilA [Polyangiaceae bacterium]